MTDMEMVLKAIDQMTPDQVRELYAYLAEKQIETSEQSLKQAPKRRILGLHAHLGPAWTSDDFDEELPDEFWFGEE